MGNRQLPFVGVYRITHWSSLRGILENGIYATNHLTKPTANYHFIGDQDLTNRRAAHPVKPPATGKLGDYVPFYFGKRSPMLYTLTKKGFAKQRDIIYLLVKLEDIVTSGLSFCFTDGHAYQHLTNFYVDLDELHQLDTATIDSKFWHQTEEDRDRPRRKSAELLVHKHVPPKLIAGIAVYDGAMEQNIQQIVSSSNFPTLLVAVRGDDYYYQ